MTKPQVNQEERPDIGPLVVIPEVTLDEFAGLFTEEEIEAIADVWQKYAGKRHKNLIVAKEQNAQSP